MPFGREVLLKGRESRDIISYKRAYTLNVAGGGVHSIDLHWKLSNSELLSRLFS
jgi:hypothetical protein